MLRVLRFPRRPNVLLLFRSCILVGWVFDIFVWSIEELFYLQECARWKTSNNLQGNLMFIGPCIIVIVEEWKTNLMSLAILFHFLCAQHVSDINISIIRSLRLCWWITTSSSCSEFVVCWRFGAADFRWCSFCRRHYMCSFNYVQSTRQETGIISWHILLLCILSLAHSTDLRGNGSFKQFLELFCLSRKTKEMKENTRDLEAYLVVLHDGFVVLCPAAGCWFRLDSRPVYVEFLFKKITQRGLSPNTSLFPCQNHSINVPY